MTDIQPVPHHSPFDQIRREDEQGEYWSARELMPLLEYHKWQDFKEAIERAMIDCSKAGRSTQENFTQLRKNSFGTGRPSIDFRLTRYACRLIVMAARTSGDVAAQARTYFSDRVDEAELLDNPDQAYLEWRSRAIRSYIAHGYSVEWAERRVDDITVRNALTHEWSIRGIKEREFPILTDRLHMGSFGITINAHKELKGFEVTYRGKKLVYKGDLPPALTATELALNALAGTVSRELHITHDSHGFDAIKADVDEAGKFVGETRKRLEELTGRPVVSARNMLKEPDGGLWGQLNAAGDEDGQDTEQKV